MTPKRNVSSDASAVVMPCSPRWIPASTYDAITSKPKTPAPMAKPTDPSCAPSHDVEHPSSATSGKVRIPPGRRRGSATARCLSIPTRVPSASETANGVSSDKRSVTPGMLPQPLLVDEAHERRAGDRQPESERVVAPAAARASDLGLGANGELELGALADLCLRELDDALAGLFVLHDAADEDGADLQRARADVVEPFLLQRGADLV